jgi:hypothetical protein
MLIVDCRDWYIEQMAQLQADEEVDEAERKFDFRFEEPDQDYVSRNLRLFILTLC